MNIGAWTMLTLGAGLIYGLLAYFIFVAITKGKEQIEQDGKRAQENSPPTEQEGCPPERCNSADEHGY